MHLRKSLGERTEYLLPVRKQLRRMFEERSLYKAIITGKGWDNVSNRQTHFS